ncbi:MAG: hypothetical protein KDD61_17620 [Bdellovibrionales bacterium]|nr:hypothetical protein [Bdellovibrionales bacterium]
MRCKRYLSLIVLLGGAWPALGLSPEVVNLNNEAVEQLTQEEPELQRSYQNLMSALSQDPFNPILRINLGLWHLKNEETVKAEKDFKAALKAFYGDAPDKWLGLPESAQKVVFSILFNLGVTSTIEKKYDQALYFYQRALFLNTESVEVKTNIELLLQAQQGGGEGDSDQENKDKSEEQKEGQGKEGDPKDQQNEQQSQRNNPSNQQKKQKFKSKELSPSDVRKFLEEIKAQEQKIRAKELEQGKKGMERENEKDW